MKVYDLTHTYKQFMPEWPSSPGTEFSVLKFHARDGLSEICWDGQMHRCTHMDAPLHVTENTPGISDYPLWRLCGTGVCVSIPKGKWGVITPEDLENASPAIQEGDIVMINTGFHHVWDDCDEYFSYGCGMSGAGANWLVGKKIKMVGYGCQANDHPIATKLVDHGLGPTHPHLIAEYKEFTGREAKEDFPLWEDAHKNLMCKGGIPGIENVGGSLAYEPYGKARGLRRERGFPCFRGLGLCNGQHYLSRRRVLRRGLGIELQLPCSTTNSS